MKVKRIYDGDATINDWWNKNAVAFSTSSWLRIYDQRLIRFGIFSEKENCVGGFVAYEGGKSWAKTLITPPYAPNIGLFFISSKHNPSQELSARKQVASAIAEFLPSSPYKWYKLDFPPDWRDVQPMVWEGFEVSPRFTYRIHLAEKGKHWMDDTDPKLRNMIMKAQRDGLKIIIPENSEIVLRQIIAGLNEKSIKHHPQLLENIINSGDESGMASLQVLDKEKPVYSAAFRIAGNEAYYLLATFDKSAGSNAISAFGLYSVIEYCREKECSVFDFEGSMIPGVEKFFRSFGGELTPYFSIKGGRPFWRWMMKKWKKG